ncbi:hypothetical protein NKR19_g6946 [Coniochaeta hoffmannii]|uniref:DNA-directed RNA polymerase I subunit RPA34.5-domain-containing protein n=1 Tax=Coniochaeta hoffmannii TaxID=91930 RepID=A0AA38RVI3_9PEZI|nr:hypothetical protein NKR19_g6946 [Coniochaeta hoffmannii]
MAGPKAPIGSLSAHSAKSANLARSASNKKNFGAATGATAKRANLKEESESDSSDSDSDSSDSGGEVDHDKVLRGIQSKASAAKSKAPTPPAMKSKVKSQPASDSKSKKAAVKQEASSSEESSSESESESEEESSSESEDEDKGAKLDKNSAKNLKKPESEDESESESESTSSSSSSESESEEEEAAKPAKKAVTKASDSKAKSKAEISSSSSTSTSESESESSESESSEEADESMAIDQRNGNNSLSRVPEVVSNEFHLRKADDGTNAADVAKFFTEAQKEGKQIWYFTAPASIPIEVVEKLEIPLERAQKGQSILSHNGDDYGVAFEDAATSRAIKLLIPSKAGDQYHMLDAPIAQTMHLKRVTQFSQNGESTLSLTQTAHNPTPRAPRPQPKGLKARFQPIGVTNGAPGSIGADVSDEDVDMTEAPALPSSQKTPAKKSKETAADQKKRKLDAAADAAATPGADSKKAKKVRVEPQPTPTAKSGAPSTATAKVTPIAPPVVPTIPRASSSQGPPTSTPSSSKASKAKAISASQPTPVSKAAEPTSSAVKKESAIPLPPSFRRASSSSASQSHAKDEPKTNGKVKKEKKSKIIKTESGTEAPKKTTPVPLPNIPSYSALTPERAERGPPSTEGKKKEHRKKKRKWELSNPFIDEQKEIRRQRKQRKRAERAMSAARKDMVEDTPTKGKAEKSALTLDDTEISP